MREANLIKFMDEVESLMVQYGVKGAMCGMHFKDGKISSGDPGDVAVFRNVFDNTDLIPKP